MKTSFAEVEGGRAAPGKPSPHRALTWRQLLDEDERLTWLQVAVRREISRRCAARCWDPAPLRALPAGGETEETEGTG